MARRHAGANVEAWQRLPGRRSHRTGNPRAARRA